MIRTIKRFTYPHAGFTLIELTVVIAILGIMAGTLIVIVNPLGQLQKARDTQRKSDLRRIQSALEMYRSDNGSYPALLNDCSGKFGSPDCSIIYMSIIPTDPKGGSYIYTPGGTPVVSYTLSACLENVNDPQAAGGASCSVAGGTGITYTVTNP